MSPTSGQRPGQRSGVVAFAPIVVAVCVIIAVREGVEALFPGASSWIPFVAALVAGWLAYAAVERHYPPRAGSKGRGRLDGSGRSKGSGRPEGGERR